MTRPEPPKVTSHQASCVGGFPYVPQDRCLPYNRARRGLRRHLSLVQKQVLARYLFYFALPITAMFAVGFAMDGGRRAITLLAMLALMPALLMASTSRLEPIATWVARRTGVVRSSSSSGSGRRRRTRSLSASTAGPRAPPCRRTRGGTVLRRRRWRTVCWPVRVSGYGARSPAPRPPARAGSRSRPRSRGRRSWPGGRGGPPRRSAGGTPGCPVVVVSAVSGRCRTGGHLRRAVFRAQFCWLLLHVAPLRAEALAAPQYTSLREAASPRHAVDDHPGSSMERHLSAPRHRPTGLVRVAAAKARRRSRAGSGLARSVGCSRPETRRPYPHTAQGAIIERMGGIGLVLGAAVSSARRTTRVSWPCSSTTWAGTRARPT